MIDRITTFLRETRVELRKVTWPTRQEIVQYTMTVIVISAVVAFFLGGLDYVFQFVLNRFIL